MREYGVTVQSVLPSYVSTKLVGHMEVKFSVPTPERYVSSALNTVGITSRTYGYIHHALQGLIFDLPETLYHAILKKEYDQVKEHLRKIKIAKKT